LRVLGISIGLLALAGVVGAGGRGLLVISSSLGVESVLERVNFFDADDNFGFGANAFSN